MKKIGKVSLFMEVLLMLLCVGETQAGPSKNLGYDYPDAIIWGGTGNSPFQIVNGDINGNGIGDIIVVGSTLGSIGGNKKYVGVFFDATLSSLNQRKFSSPDFLIKTKKQYPWSADVVKYHPMHWLAVADLNQDGFDDIVFSLPIIDLGNGLRDEKGEVYVVLGNTRANLGSVWDFSSKPPSFTFFGKDPGDRAGWSVATGDINGDGKKDLLIGAPQADGPSNTFTDGGEIYGMTSINFGQGSMVLSESNVNLYIYGETNEKYGYATTTGNLNGDTNLSTGYPLADIIMVPSYQNLVPAIGPIKIIFGSPLLGGSKRLSLNSNWTSSYKLSYIYPNLAIGDINNDGIDDLASSDAVGRNYLTYGSRSTISILADVLINYQFGNFGFSIYITDFDGDGFKDIAYLAPSENNGIDLSIPIGRAYVIWGKSARLPSTIDLATETTHFTLFGSKGDGPTGLSSNFQGPWNSRYGCMFGKDLNGDGKSELFFSGSWNQNSYIYKINK